MEPRVLQSRQEGAGLPWGQPKLHPSPVPCDLTFVSPTLDFCERL